MDLNQLNIVINQIKNLIEENASLVEKNEKFNIIFEQEQKKYLNLLEQEKEKLFESENKSTLYLKQINELEEKISLLRKDNSEKSSKTIWETTQYKIKEKDEQIEELKKSVEFYKRKHTVSTRNSIDIKQEPEPKLELNLEAKPETKLETKLEAKPETKLETKLEAKPETKLEAKPDKNQLLKIRLPEVEQEKEQDIEQEKKACVVIKSVKNTKSTKTTKSRDNELKESSDTKEKPVNTSNSNKKIIQIKEKVEPLISNNLEDDLEKELAALM
jgi:translation initiation factor IF-2